MNKVDTKKIKDLIDFLEQAIKEFEIEGEITVATYTHGVFAKEVTFKSVDSFLNNLISKDLIK